MSLAWAGGVEPAAPADGLHPGGSRGEGCWDLEPEPVPVAGELERGRQGGHQTHNSGEWAWEPAFLLSQSPGDSGEALSSQIPTPEAEF